MSLAANIRNGCNHIGGENDVFFLTIPLAMLANHKFFICSSKSLQHI